MMTLWTMNPLKQTEFCSQRITKNTHSTQWCGLDNLPAIEYLKRLPAKTELQNLHSWKYWHVTRNQDQELALEGFLLNKHRVKFLCNYSIERTGWDYKSFSSVLHRLCRDASETCIWMGVNEWMCLLMLRVVNVSLGLTWLEKSASLVQRTSLFSIYHLCQTVSRLLAERRDK